MRCRGRTLNCFWLRYVVFVSSVWNNLNIMVRRDVIMVVMIRTAVIIIVSRDSDSRDYDSLTVDVLTAVIVIV